jgi:hypothetical protein
MPPQVNFCGSVAESSRLAACKPLQVAKYDLVLNINRTPDSVLLDRCVFRNNRARGTLLKANNVVVVVRLPIAVGLVP